MFWKETTHCWAADECFRWTWGNNIIASYNIDSAYNDRAYKYASMAMPNCIHLIYKRTFFNHTAGNTDNKKLCFNEKCKLYKFSLAFLDCMRCTLAHSAPASHVSAGQASSDAVALCIVEWTLWNELVGCNAHQCKNEYTQPAYIEWIRSLGTDWDTRPHHKCSRSEKTWAHEMGL